MRRVVSACDNHEETAGKRGDLFRMQQALHRPAVGVTAEDDILDVEDGQGEFDGRCFAPVARAVWRDDVPGIAKDE